MRVRQTGKCLKRGSDREGGGYQMLTIEKLKEFGADVDEGLQRCLNNNDFYLRMVNMGIQDGMFDKLEASLSAGDLDGAFEAAHALKGILGNLSITPILTVVSEMTELLRARTQTDYSEMLKAVLEGRDALKKMAEE